MTNYLFIDIETTGLDEHEGQILEVAAIATNDDLEEIARDEWLVMPSVNPDGLFDAFVLEMHTNNGLIEAFLEDGKPLWWVESRLADLVDYTFGPLSGDVVLAGASVDFDRRWLALHMPELSKRFHYRTLDVSSFARFLANTCDTELGRESRVDVAHRAMPDIEHTLEGAREIRRLVLDRTGSNR